MSKQLLEEISVFLKFYPDYVLVPVPLSKKSLLDRGFNQSQELAKEVTKKTGIPVMNLLKKIKETKKQAQLSKIERERNLKDCFQCFNTTVPKKVLLIDDVATTLSTLTECATILRNAGVVEVSAFVLARAPLHG